jgi:hypothetical protein
LPGSSPAPTISLNEAAFLMSQEALPQLHTGSGGLLHRAPLALARRLRSRSRQALSPASGRRPTRLKGLLRCRLPNPTDVIRSHRRCAIDCGRVAHERREFARSRGAHPCGICPELDVQLSSTPRCCTCAHDPKQKCTSAVPGSQGDRITRAKDIFGGSRRVTGYRAQSGAGTVSGRARERRAGFLA